jgi:hypothetical protein
MAAWLARALSTTATIVVLVLSALFTYYYWSKRYQEHSLSRLAQGLRWSGVAVGLLLLLIEFQFRSGHLWFLFVVLVTELWVLVLVLVPDASHYLAQACLRWMDRGRQ